MLMPMVTRAVSTFSSINSLPSLRSAGVKALGLPALLALLAFPALSVTARAQSTLTVDTTADSTDSTNDCSTGAGSACSLRDAINQANTDNDGDTIVFKSSVTGTITLGSALPQINADMLIEGPGANLLTVSGAGNYEVLYVNAGQVDISGLTIANGVAPGPTGNAVGGGLFNGSGTVTIANCSFTNNTAAGFGGAISNSGALVVSGSTFNGNTATAGGSGGAIINNETLTAYNNTFYNSQAGSGAAIYSNGTTTITLTNNTFYGNVAVLNGGAVDNYGTLTANNNIFANNVGTPGAGIYNAATANATYNLYYDNFNNGTTTEDDCNSCTNNVPATTTSNNPLTLTLGSYGGPTQTLLPQVGSAAICSGSSSVAVNQNSNALTIDQRGFALNSSCVDAGSVQSNYLMVQALGDAGTGPSDCPGTACTLRDAISVANSNSYGDIAFSSSLSLPGSIDIGGGGPGGAGSTIGITGQINVLGPGAGQVTINGDSDTNVGSVVTIGSGSQVLLSGLTISGGMVSSTSGGGISNQGTLTLLNSVVSGNNSQGASGAGIYNSGTLTLTDSNVSGNSTLSGSGGGGGIYSTGTLTLNESTVAGNSLSFLSSIGGAGILIGSGTATITDSTISGNTAQHLCPGGPTCLGGSGGGILNGGTLTMSNSIVAGNLARANNDVAGAIVATGSYNLIGDGTGMSGLTNGTKNNMVGSSGTPINPMLSGMQANGLNAMVSTMIPLPGSPAICAASASNIPAGITTDERGYPLVPTSGYCASGSIDIGAVQTNYTGLEFVTQTSNTPVGSVMSPAPTVEAIETDTLLSSSNIDAVNLSGMTTAMGLTDQDGALASGSTQSIVNGTVELDGLQFTTAEAGDALTATLPVTSSATLSTTSGAFNIIGPAAQFVLNLPTPVTAGTQFSFTVTAEDSAGNTATSYAGTVQFTSSDTNAAVVLPSTGTLTNGVGTFNATLITGGNQSITATDTVNTGITGTNSTLVEGAAAATLSVFGYPTTWYAGAMAEVAITAIDQYGNASSSFTGPVTVTSSDSAATIAQFISFSNGQASYSVIFNTQGTQSISVSSAGLPSASETGITIGPMPSFLVTVSTDATDGMDTAADCTNQSLSGATPDASCSLRDALWAADYLGAGNITFSSSAFGAPTTITLTAPQNSGNDFGALPVGANITLTGPTTGTGSPLTNLVTVKGATPAAPLTGSAVLDVYGTPYSIDAIGPDAIANLNLANGNGTTATGDGSGTGGINNQATLSLTNVSVTGNTGDLAGGFYNYSGDVTVSGSTFSNNSSTGVGGPGAGAFFSDTSTGTPKFVNDHPFAAGRIASFRGTSAPQSSSTTNQHYFGSATGGQPGFAGRVRPMGGSKSATSSDGRATTPGGIQSQAASNKSAFAVPLVGPVSISSPTVTITNTTFSNNSGFLAGAFYDYSDQVSISGSTFANNSASVGAGALVVDVDGFTAADTSTFSKNTGGFTGAALAVDGGVLQIESSTLNGNISLGERGAPIIDGGGLIAFEGGLALLDYDTFYNNLSLSGVGAGAISDVGTFGGFVAGFNLTVTGNTGYFGAFIDDSSSENDVENTISSGNVTTDPTAAGDGISPDATGIEPNFGDVFTTPGIKLAPHGNYGGMTDTILPLPGSVVICAGSVEGLSDASSFWGLNQTTDQRGYPNFNSTYLNTGGTCIDAGAVQTNYSIAMTTQPPTEAAVNVPFNPAPVVTLYESSVPISATGSVTMSDSANQLAGTVTENLSAGSAVFNKLKVTSLQSGDALTATLLLNAPVTFAVQATQTINVVSDVPAVLSPSSGTLTATQLFTWMNGEGPVLYQLKLGTAGFGSTDLLDTGSTTATSVKASIPSDGLTVYASFFQYFDGAWQKTEYTFTEPGTTTPATLTPGSGTLSSGPQTFTWSNGAGPAEFYLKLGTAGYGSTDLLSTGFTTATSATVNIPGNGVTIYASFFQLINNVWQKTEYTYTESGSTTMATLTPSSGTLLATQTFAWSNGVGPAEYYLKLGTTGFGSTDLLNTGSTTQTSATVTIPANGKTVYATFFQLINNVWQRTEYTFTEP